MSQPQPDFNQCSNLREAAKRAWDWAWNNPELNPDGQTPMDCSPQQKAGIHQATLMQLIQYALEQAERQAGHIDRERAAYDLADALQGGLEDWIRDNVAATLEDLEKGAEGRWVDAGWVPTHRNTDQEETLPNTPAG